jgi:hypothetical protein
MQQSRLYRVEMGSPTVSLRFWYSSPTLKTTLFLRQHPSLTIP